ncbi:MAG TPA: DEAD/DEAH box helicase [Ignavibacteria bacterium]
MISESFNLSSQILLLLEKNGITIATPVQKEIIPAVLDGRDVLAQSETGSGKTISFAVPIIEQLNQKDGIAALILVPTRELCIQITNEFLKFSRGKHLEITSVYGGVSIENQIRKLKKTSIIVATPGRLLDLLNRGSVKLDKIKYLVFDEADRMLDMGFIIDIEKILKRIPQKRQTMLFSATVTKEIAKLSHKYLDNPIKVTLESEVKPEFLNQTYYKTTTEQKLKLLIYLLKHERDLTLVFCNRKRITDRLAKNLCAEGINAKCLHGDMTQSQRERVTSDFRNKKFNVLIATDVASRGLHIEDISHVYNYEVPKEVESYTHRVGRTARAGKKGEAISLVAGGEDQKFFKQILFNHNGVIKLKNIDPKVLPELKQKSPDHKKKNEVKGHSGGKHPHEIKSSGGFKEVEKRKTSFKQKPKQWKEEKPHRQDAISTDKWENEQPLTSEIARPKPWDDKRPRPFGERKSSHWKDKRPGKFGERKSNHRDNNGPDKFGEQKSKHWGKNKTKTFGQTNPDSSGDRKLKPWEEKKPKLFNKVKSKTFKKYKDKSKDDNNPRSWEERRPKFWSEKKAKTWRDSLQKMPNKP